MRNKILPLLLLFALVACTRVPAPGGEEGLVRLSLDSKAGDPSYEGTFRVALFNTSYAFTGYTGSYCTSTQSHTDAHSGSERRWLDPCRVDANGNPLDASGDPATLATADKRGEWGLHWSTDGQAQRASLVAVSPAVQIHADDVYAYVNWRPDVPIYISDAPTTNVPYAGSWMDGEYVYTSEAKVSELMDRRASITIRIECGELDAGDLQQVAVTRWIKSDRYYLRGTAAETIKTGFSLLNTPAANRHATLNAPGESIVLFNHLTDGGIKHLTKSPAVTWTSTVPAYFPAFDFADENLDDSLRPVFTVTLGADPTNPIRAKVVMNQKLEPMKNYIYTLYLSKARIDLHLTVTDWNTDVENDAGSASPVYLGSITPVSGDAWDDDGEIAAGGWKN